MDNPLTNKHPHNLPIHVLRPLRGTNIPTTSGCAKLSLKVEIAVFFAFRHPKKIVALSGSFVWGHDLAGYLIRSLH